jgi:epoxyqueuosine reductase QueG
VTLVDTLRAALAPAGLNHLGVVSASAYDAVAPAHLRTEVVHPGARAIVVVGSGGRAHWDAFMAWIAQDPVGRLGRRRHPLDDFTAETFTALAGQGPLEGSRVIYPTFSAPLRLDFIALGELAGLGRRSELRILVSERWGPWFALRAAVFTSTALAPSPVAPRLCDGCAAPCLAVVPAGVERASYLRARQACVIAPTEQYAAAESTYHYDRAAGRRLLCARFGVRDEVGA